MLTGSGRSFNPWVVGSSPTGPTDLSAAWQRLRDRERDADPRRAADVQQLASRGPADPLTGREREVLDFEARHWPLGGAKDTAIREGFGWSPTRYSQVLCGLLERRAAVEHAPQLVERLRERVTAGRARRGW